MQCAQRLGADVKIPRGAGGKDEPKKEKKDEDVDIPSVD